MVHLEGQFESVDGFRSRPEHATCVVGQDVDSGIPRGERRRELANIIQP
jgi:hypothetical protein